MITRKQRKVAAGAGLLMAGVIGLIVTAMLRPNLVRNTSTHPRTWILAGVALLVVVLVGVVVKRLTGKVWVARLAQLVPVVVVLALVIVPTFRGSAVDEADPLAGLVTPPSKPEPAVPGATSDPGPAPEGPRELASSAFVGIDHDVTGSARLIDLGHGDRVIRFEDFDVEPGPDYFVHLIDGADQQRPEGARLGSLKGTRGNQNYEVGGEVQISRTATVLIWCRAFAVPVANATLTW